MAWKSTGGFRGDSQGDAELNDVTIGSIELYVAILVASLPAYRSSVCGSIEIGLIVHLYPFEGGVKRISPWFQYTAWTVRSW